MPYDLRILEHVVESSPTGIGVFRVNDFNDLKSIQYVYINRIILHEMRKTKEEVFGKYIHEVAPEAYEHEVGLQVIKTYRDVALFKGNINLGVVEYSNSEVAGLYDCSVHYMYDNYILLKLENVTDVEKEVKERTSDLVQKNNELEHFSYMASHDLQEPLNSLNMFVDLIQDIHSDNVNDELGEILNFVSESAKRMKKVTTTLLDYNRLGIESEIKRVDTKKIIEEVKLDLKQRIKKSNAKIYIQQDLPELKAYPTELRLLFQNLISNAIKFAKPKIVPEIHISVENKNGWTFSIRDNGIGMSLKENENIFSLFHRVDKSSDIDGSGIGLAHCKKITELHNGKIWVDSIEGKGSTFHFNINT